MFILSREELIKIEGRVAQAQVRDASLSVDLIDHICCMVEERVEHGMKIEQAEDEVFKEMGEVQLKSIEIETKILTQNKYTMKNRTKIIGYIAAGLLLSGTLMKTLHLMGAGIVFGSGVLLAAFGFLLILFFDNFSYSRSVPVKVSGVIGYLGSAAVLLGYGSKFMNWPIAGDLIAAGGFILLIYFLINSVVNDRAHAE